MLSGCSVVVLLSEIHTVVYSRPISPLNCLKHSNYFSFLRYRSDTVCLSFVWLSRELICVVSYRVSWLIMKVVCLYLSKLLEFLTSLTCLGMYAASIYNYYNESYNICVFCKVLIMYYETNAILCKTLFIIYTRMYVCTILRFCT